MMTTLLFGLASAYFLTRNQSKLKHIDFAYDKDGRVPNRAQAMQNLVDYRGVFPGNMPGSKASYNVMHHEYRANFARGYNRPLSLKQAITRQAIIDGYREPEIHFRSSKTTNYHGFNPTQFARLPYMHPNLTKIVFTHSPQEPFTLPDGPIIGPRLHAYPMNQAHAIVQSRKTDNTHTLALSKHVLQKRPPVSHKPQLSNNVMTHGRHLMK